jgi:LAO/AO transport system kinase
LKLLKTQYKPLESVLKTDVLMELVESVLAGDRLALARLLSLIENQEENGFEALAALYSRTGRAHIIGVTGAPGTGKSTLVNSLAKVFRQSDDKNKSAATVGVIAVDPSSPFSGGAILGDRIRMRDLAGDPGVFVRSMASRGTLGGLASTTAGVAQALDAAGFDVILIETVGAGQAEVDIARTAHTTIVVSAPGMGDEVQAIKAGIMEIADILVVNKADLPGAESAVRALQATLEMGRSLNSEDAVEGEVQWAVPVLTTISTQGEGFDNLLTAILQHRQFLHVSQQWDVRERERIRFELDLLLRENLVRRFFNAQPEGVYDALIDQVIAREISPWQAVQGLFAGEER